MSKAKRYYADAVWRYEDGKRIDVILGDFLSSNPEKAFVPIYLASDYDALIKVLDKNCLIMSNAAEMVLKYDTLLAQARRLRDCLRNAAGRKAVIETADLEVTPLANMEGRKAGEVNDA